jgi:hypothetical protein
MTYKLLERMNGDKVVAQVEAENQELAVDSLMRKLWHDNIQLCDDLGYDSYQDLQDGFNLDFIVVES